MRPPIEQMAASAHSSSSELRPGGSAHVLAFVIEQPPQFLDRLARFEFTPDRQKLVAALTNSASPKGESDLFEAIP